MEKIEEIRNLICKIEDAAADGDYIFRGEDKDYGKVSSGFYREYFEGTGFNLADCDDGFVNQVFEEKIVREATSWEYEEGWRYYEHYDPNIGGWDGTIWNLQGFCVKSKLQHYGGKTNLIDFTEDILIALYFACNGEPNEDGRIILLRSSERKPIWKSNVNGMAYESSVDSYVWKPKEPAERADNQKSVFVQPKNGFFVPRNPILVPKKYKKDMLIFLEEEYGINRKYVYGDLHGFIQYQATHKNEVMESEDVLEGLIDKYTESIKRNPGSESYCRRGLAYALLGKLEDAKDDFLESIHIQPTSDAYHYHASALIKTGCERIVIERTLARAVGIFPLLFAKVYWDLLTENYSIEEIQNQDFRWIARFVQEIYDPRSVENPPLSLKDLSRDPAQPQPKEPNP